MAKDSCNMDKQARLCCLCYAIISFLSALIGGIILLLVEYFFCSNCNGKYTTGVDLIVSAMTAIATIVSAILMWKTFKFQRKTYKEEQFKAAFYTMLNSHRKLTDNLKVKTTILNERLGLKSKTYMARQCFLYARREVAKIIDVLSQDKYLGMLQDSDNQRILHWEIEGENYADDINERKRCDAKVEQAVLEYKRKYCLGAYCLSEGLYNECKGRSDKTIFAFRTFLESWLICYEHYMRNLSQLLMYVNQEMPVDFSKKFYINSIAFQMAREELWFIKQYSHIDSSFHKCYTDSGMDKVVEEQLTK